MIVVVDLIPRAGYGLQLSAAVVGQTHRVSAVIPAGVILGPVDIHFRAAGTVDAIVLVGLSRSGSENATSLEGIEGPIMWVAAGVAPPGGQRFIFGAAGGNYSTHFEWGLRTQTTGKRVIVALALADNTQCDVSVVVGATEVLLSGTPLTGAVSGFRRRSSDVVT